MKNSLKKYPFFLFLLPLFLIIHIWKEFHPLIKFEVVYSEILILLILPFALLLIFYIGTKSIQKAALLSFILCLAFYFIGEIKDWLMQVINSEFLRSYTFLLPLSLILIIICAALILKNRSGFGRSFLFLNTLFLLIVAVDLSLLIYKIAIGNRSFPFAIAKDYQPCNNCEKPDIFFLVFDSYTSTGLLKEELNYDNSSLDSALKQRGFQIIYGSRSNYNLTPFSIGSSFNMDYLENVDTSKIYRLRNYLPAVKKVYDNALIQILEKEGYEIRNHSLFDMRNSPTSIPGFDIWGTKQLFEQHNLYKKLSKDIGWQFPGWLRTGPSNKLKTYAINRDTHDSTTINNILKSAAEKNEKPVFVYGHLFLPHSPYTYDSTGKKIEPVWMLNPVADKNAYVEQIIYTKKIMLQLIDSILANRKRPLALIIQGDHGYRFFDQTKNEKEFPNLNAVYFSSGKYAGLGDSNTNVQTFRFLLNNWFGKQYPYLEDHFYFLHYK